MRKLITAILAVAMMATMSVSVLANNHKDETAIFNFSNGASMQTNPCRLKEDSSFAYMQCTGTSYAYTASVLGAYAPYGAVSDVSNGRSYSFSSGTVHYMSNYAKEWGYSHAGIAATPSNIYSYTAITLWSPDSV